MLVIFLGTLYKRMTWGQTQVPENYRLSAVYVHSTQTFAEVDDFVDNCSETYGLQITKYPFPLKEAFSKYLEKEPHVKAIFVGIRRSDPYGDQLKYQQQTDHGWPDFVRIHPVLEWHYAEIWEFLRTLSVPYCHLYDMGYTSLGGTNNTVRNPLLANKDGTFQPAYELVGDDNERLGRTK
jgi:FAD synthetase